MIFEMFMTIKNFLRKNRNIKSKLVSSKAIIGCNTRVMRGTAIDRQSIVGKYCYIGNYCYITKVNIGNYCSIANNVSIGQGERDLVNISTSSLFYDNPYEKLTEKDCSIGNDVCIGVDAIISRGVRIGNGAVIGANSTVIKDIPAYAVAVGSPARVIKYRFDKEKIAKIEQSKWWEYDLAKARELISEQEHE